MLAAFKWSPEYETGLRAIDRDHRNLFSVVNDLIAESGRADAARQIAATIDSLARYVDEHFEREEMFMARAGFPGLTGHRAEHRRLRGLVRALRDIFAARPESVDLEKLLSFLEEWIRDHILRCDLEAVPWLKGERAQEGGPGPKAVSMAKVDLRVTVPAGRADTILEVALLLNEKDERVDALDDVLHQFIDAHRKYLRAQAERLFCKKPEG